EVHRRQRQKAEEILAMARGGSNFKELAGKYSEGPSSSEGGALGTVTKGQMIKAFEEAAFSLEEGAISDVVKTSFGYHIILVEDISPASTKPLSEVRDAVRRALQTEEARPLSFKMANAAYEGIISAGSLQAYLDAHPEAEAKTTDFFSKTNPPADAGFDQKFLNTAFTLKEGELSSLIETSNGYAILFAEAVIPPKVPQFREVKEQVIADYTSHQAGELANETASALLQKAKKTQNLKNSARSAGFTVQSSEYLSKNAQQETTLPADLVQSAFELSANTPYPDDVLAANAEFYVYEFVDRRIPQASPDREQAARYENAIMQRKQQQILSSWLENKRQQAEIFRHKRL
ncbi:MAG: peptidylprolyl isomerase, partial [Desulfopila sp.]